MLRSRDLGDRELRKERDGVLLAVELSLVLVPGIVALESVLEAFEAARGLEGWWRGRRESGRARW